MTARQRLDRRMCHVLRHVPESVGITLDSAGWVDIDGLARALSGPGRAVTRDDVLWVVATNDKRRFAVDGDRIRANQGHSVPVDLALAPRTPPPVLFHGSARHRVESIRRDGLVRGRRHHVHLSPDTVTARSVGARHGAAVVWRVDTAAMSDDRWVFFCSDNGVWLVDRVPVDYLALLT